MNVSNVKDTVISNISSTPMGFSTGHVTSADGTTIGYRRIGSGPGLVIMHGGLRASQHYERLASALADIFTVYIPDRRGRGLSGPAGDDYSVVKECNDLAAILQQTKAHMVFGHSGGGLFALESAIDLPIDKLALYDPAVSINGSLPLDWLPVYEQAISCKDYAEAMVLVIKGLPLNWMSKLPGWILHPLFSLMLRGEERNEITELLLTFVLEAKEGIRLDSTYERYRNIQAETLLLGGGNSPNFLLDVLPILAKTIPNVRTMKLPGLDHTAPDEDAPEAVASVLREFFNE